jgi:hypothetical protein
MPEYNCRDCDKRISLHFAPPRGKTVACPRCKEPMKELVNTLYKVPEAIGFEYETDFGVANAAYQDQLLGAVNGLWKATADDNIIELVTKPFVNMPGLVQAHREMVALVCGLAKAEDHKPLSTTVNGAKKDWGPLAQIDLRPTNNSWTHPPDFQPGTKPLGAPQVSMGVPLHKMHALLTAARTFELLEHLDCEATTLQGQRYLFQRGTNTMDALATAAAWKTLMETHCPGPTAKDANSALGLMTLVLQVLIDGDAQLGAPEYSKGVLSVLHRTDFHSMYALLGTAQAWFTLESVLFCFYAEADLPYARQKVTQNGVNINNKTFLEILTEFSKVRVSISSGLQQVVGTGYVFPRGFKAKGAWNLISNEWAQYLSPEEKTILQQQTLLHGPVINDWIKSIIDPGTASQKARKWDRLIVDQGLKYGDNVIQLNELSGKDLLSRSMCAFDSVSLGRLGVKNGDCAVIEFRRWPLTSLPCDYWESLARRLYVMYASVCGQI